MKKNLLIIILLSIISSIETYSQSSGLSYELFIRPSISFMTNKIYPSDNAEYPICFTSSYGFYVIKEIKENVWLSSGLTYETYGYNFNDYSEVFTSDGSTNSMVDLEKKSRCKYINIPLYFTKKINNESFYRIGLQNNYLIQTRNYERWIFESEEIIEEDVENHYRLKKLGNHRMYNPAIKISYGYVIQINSTLSLIIEPTIATMLLATYSSNSDLNLNEFSFGISINLRYQKRNDPITP